MIGAMSNPTDSYIYGQRSPDGEWHFCLPITVRFSDMDTFGHVNNAVYLTYAESARIAYFRQLEATEAATQMDMILGRSEVDYRLPVVFGDHLTVEVRASAIGTKSFTLAYRMTVERAGQTLLACEARTVLVCYSYAIARSVPVPPDLIAALEAFEGRALRGERPA